MGDWLSHAMLGVLLTLPWQSLKGIRMLDAQAVRDPRARLIFYRSAIFSQWAITLITVAIIWSADPQYVTQLFTLQFANDSLTVFGLAALIVLSQSPLVPIVRERMERSAATRRALYPIRNLIPRSAPEKQLWINVSVTAGICEEILFRGFLFFYAQSILGLELLGAVALSSAIFAISHLYQGTANMFRVGVIGVILGTVYAVSGNLLPCIALHAILDLGGLRMGAIVPPDEPVAKSTNINDS